MSHKVLFIDRDGTLIREPPDHQVDALDKVQLVKGVIPELCTLRDHGYRFVMVTNQDGLGTEAYPQASFDGPHQLMMQLFESQGIVFRDVLVDRFSVVPDDPDRPATWDPRAPLATPTAGRALALTGHPG